MKIQLGKTYSDKITGFKGVAGGFCMYISGCAQVLLVPKVDKEGKKREGEWFDEQRLVEGKEKIIALDNANTPGFDREAPKR